MAKNVQTIELTGKGIKILLVLGVSLKTVLPVLYLLGSILSPNMDAEAVVDNLLLMVGLGFLCSGAAGAMAWFYHA